MYEKVYEENYNSKVLKGYKCPEFFEIVKFINQITDAKITINNIYVNENSDLGMKTFEGNYNLEKFLLMYDQFDKESIDSIRIELDNNMIILINNNKYINLTSGNGIDLNELLSSGIKKEM